MIKTTIIEQPTTRFITLKCPKCEYEIGRVVKIDQYSGRDECGLCHTKFEWEEVNDATK